MFFGRWSAERGLLSEGGRAGGEESLLKLFAGASGSFRGFCGVGLFGVVSCHGEVEFSRFTVLVIRRGTVIL